MHQADCTGPCLHSLRLNAFCMQHHTLQQPKQSLRAAHKLLVHPAVGGRALTRGRPPQQPSTGSVACTLQIWPQPAALASGCNSSQST